MRDVVMFSVAASASAVTAADGAALQIAEDGDGAHSTLACTAGGKAEQFMAALAGAAVEIGSHAVRYAVTPKAQ